MPVLLVLAIITAWSPLVTAAEAPYQCEPTVEDEMVPFYRPDAPYRNSVGTGYLLVGTVKAAHDCRPIPSAKIELWMTGPDGQ